MKNLKRILAIICIVLLVGMYIVTFIFAITDNTASMTLFKGSVACTIFLPVVFWFYIKLHEYGMKRSGRKDTSDKSSNACGDNKTK